MLKIDCKRPTLQFTLSDGTTQEWSYDIVLAQMELDRLYDAHGMREEGGKLRKPDAAFLADWSAALIAKLGMPECTLDLALRMQALVATQFNQLSRSIADQISRELKQ